MGEAAMPFKPIDQPAENPDLQLCPPAPEQLDFTDTLSSEPQDSELSEELKHFFYEQLAENLRLTHEQSSDIHKGLLLGLAYNTNSVDDAGLGELSISLDSVFRTRFGNEIGSTPEGITNDILFDLFDQLIEEKNPVALILDGFMSNERANGVRDHATYLIRFYLANEADRRDLFDKN